MTDYTPENRIQEAMDPLHSRETSAEKSLRFTDRKFAELVREASRLKGERDEFLALLKQTLPYLNDIINHGARDMAISVIGADIELTKARELIAKVEK